MSVKIRTKKLKNGSESIYLDIYYKGNRQYEFLGINIEKNDKNKKQKKEIAEKIRSKKELELGIEAYDIPNNLNGKEDFLKYFKENCKNKPYLSAYNRFEKFCKNKTTNGKIPFNRLDEKLFEDFKEWLLKEISHNSAWVYFAKVKTILNKAVKEKKINLNPAKYVKIRMQETERTYLTLDEVKKLKETKCDHKNIKDAFLFSCFTGLRFSDVRELTWEQIRDDKLFFRQKKTRGIEYLPLNQNAINILSSIKNDKIKSEERVFNLQKKSELVGAKLREWAEAAGINKYLTFHVARHSFAVISLSSDIDFFHVSKLLGHKNTKMTEVYLKIVNKDLVKAVNKIPTI